MRTNCNNCECNECSSYDVVCSVKGRPDAKSATAKLAIFARFTDCFESALQNPTTIDFVISPHLK